MSNRLYKPCMCLIWSQWCRCLYIALSLSVSTCSCVRTSRVLFVLPMYKELQPGQVNSYTTYMYDWLNGGVLSLVLVKKHNFVVFCFIWMSTCGSTRRLHLSFLTSCVVTCRSPTNGMVSRIVECWLLWEVSVVIGSGALFYRYRIISKYYKYINDSLHLLPVL